MILAGQVLVNDQRIDKPGQLVETESEIRLKGEPAKYVGRGGLKLEAALREFSVTAEGKVCLDVGASTGGFTDCLLQHGARKVWAIDVGHNQIAWRLRADPRVEVVEGMNARNLDPGMFPSRFQLATIDVSFISLSKVLPALNRCLINGADCIALVKPQFEVGKGQVGRGGIVREPERHRHALLQVVNAAAVTGLAPVQIIESPLLGAKGNREFLLHLRSAKPDQAIAELVRADIARLTS
jgi:23S rRNA (cytidine1920-2'-O)/16S rRNA (cytidine1409-2'-O)-methyltransferase